MFQELIFVKYFIITILKRIELVNDNTRSLAGFILVVYLPCGIFIVLGPGIWDGVWSLQTVPLLEVSLVWVNPVNPFNPF